MTEPVVYLNGRSLPKSQATLSPDDRGFLFGDGVYEVVRSYGGHLFELDAHLQRLHRGMTALEFAGHDEIDFGDVVRDLLVRNDLAESDATVYVQVTRGVAPRLHRFPEPGTPLTVYAFASPFRPKGDPHGVKVITAPDVRWSRCDIKSVNLLGNCLAHQRAYEAGALEAILIRDGVALEASAASYFAVVAGEVRTTPKTNYILPSITRDVAIDLCHREGIPVRETPIYEDELVRADELFLASTTVELMPITQVNDTVIGRGDPGPVTRRLMTRFAERTAALHGGHARGRRGALSRARHDVSHPHLRDEDPGRHGTRVLREDPLPLSARRRSAHGAHHDRSLGLGDGRGHRADGAERLLGL